MTMKALVPAAGKGKRMLGLCDHIPKPLLPVANEPMIGHVLRSLRGAGIEEAAVIVGYKADAVKDFVRDGSQFGVDVTYLVQEVPNGTGSATLLGKDFVGDDPFVLAFADIMVHPDFYASFANRLLERECDALMAVRIVDDPHEGAAVYADENYRVSKVIEKPKPGTSTTNYNSAGMFAFRPAIFDQLGRLPRSERGEYELTQAIDMAIDEKRPVEAWVIEQYWSNVSSPADLLSINEEVLRDQCCGEPLVDPSARISPDAALDRLCAIGAGSEVGACRIGPNVCLGEGVKVGDAADLAQCIVMDDAQIGEGASLANAVVRQGARLAACADVEGTPDEAEIV